jgi:predicted nucleic acid-binding protein
MIAVDANILVYAPREDSPFHDAAGVRELWSADRDFKRFAGLNVVNPLIGPA